ncbi:hypothetical protein RLEG3_03990 (plasmid) [Rhizobium leguminosarum bv. trifolii WSM1689]|uniref:hypothetical protein n=1 Tax=Rhizobium leguminosarum TaxID=384 RepID=UPI0003E0B841|nr:hypothetical protein [Rhizobium leguminosarum]AHF88266.1 hypothetical protein RLEG3_03990 [Rhizobium leguminosarum bv. trifolii WSM1689]
MKNFYWIDSFDGYPPTMDHAIRVSVDTYENVYPQFTEALGYRFHLVTLEDLRIECGPTLRVVHDQYGNLLEGEGAAYVGLIHPDLQKERKLETLYRIFAYHSRFALLNFTPSHPMVCKDKFSGTSIAQELGLSVLPTCLLDTGSSLQLDHVAIEHALRRYPLFVRPADLTAGLGKKVLHNVEALQKYLRQPPFPGRLYIVQPFIEIEAEYRVYLSGSNIVACRKRRPLREGESCATPPGIAVGSQALATYLNTTYLCVDWIANGSDFWFCEFETGGGFTELSEPFRSRVATAFFRKLTR